jgi:hypothetical protein
MTRNLVQVEIIAALLPTSAVATEEAKAERIIERERRLRERQFKALGHVT